MSLSRPEAARAFLLKVQTPLARRSQPQADFACSLFKSGMVELTGIEPMTSCLQSRRSPN